MGWGRWTGIAAAVLAVSVTFWSLALPAAPRSPDGASPRAKVEKLAGGAMRAFAAGRYAEAAERYAAAHALDPRGGAFLFSSARSLQLAGQLAAAADRFRAFLQLGDSAPELRERALRHLEAILVEQARAAAPTPSPLPEPVTAERVPEPLPAAATPTQPAELSAAATPASAQPALLARPPAPEPSWGTVVAKWSGIALAVAGGAMLVAETVARQQFEDAMAAGFRGELVQGYASRQEAVARAQQLANGQNLGWGLGGAGLLLAAASWWWGRDTESPVATTRGKPLVLGVSLSGLGVGVAWH